MKCDPTKFGEPNEMGWHRHRCIQCGTVFHPSPNAPLRECQADQPIKRRLIQNRTPCPHRRRDTDPPAFDTERHILTIPEHVHSRTIAAVSCYFNPQQSSSRQRALCPFVRQWEPLGLDLYTIEASCNGIWRIPESPTAYRVHIDPDAVLFHKETLLNLAIDRLPDRYTHVLWIDSDVLMLDHDYLDRLTDALADHRVVQGFSELQYLGPRGEPQTNWRSGVAYRNATQGTKSAKPNQAYPGLIWAADRQLLVEIGGLYDRCVTGGGDVAWSCALYGDHDVPYTKHWSQPLIADVLAYSDRVAPRVPSVGYVRSRGVHLYHGKLSDRQYITRNSVLGREQFDPQRDLTYADNGTLRWSDQASPELIAAVRDYIHGRKEDD